MFIWDLSSNYSKQIVQRKWNSLLKEQNVIIIRLSNGQISDSYMIFLDVNGFQLRPLWAKRVTLSIEGASFNFGYEEKVWVFGIELKSFEGSLSSDYILLIIVDFVFNVENQFLDLLASFLSFLKDPVLLIPGLFLRVAVDKVGVYTDEHFDRISLFHDMNQIHRLLQYHLPQLFYSFYLGKLVLKLTLIQEVLENGYVKLEQSPLLERTVHLFNQHQRLRLKVVVVF